MIHWSYTVRHSHTSCSDLSYLSPGSDRLKSFPGNSSLCSHQPLLCPDHPHHLPLQTIFLPTLLMLVWLPSWSDYLDVDLVGLILQSSNLFLLALAGWVVGNNTAGLGLGLWAVHQYGLVDPAWSPLACRRHRPGRRRAACNGHVSFVKHL